MNIRESKRGGYIITLSEDEACGVLQDLEYYESVTDGFRVLARNTGTHDLALGLDAAFRETEAERARLADCN